MKKNVRLQKECRRLRAELAQVQAERDGYLKSLYALTRKPFVFTRAEIRAMEKNPVTSHEILEAARKGTGK